MFPSRRVAVAFTLSVLLHLLVVLLLALLPESPAAAEVPADLAEPAPLEIALQSEPAPTPEPVKTASAPTPTPAPTPFVRPTPEPVTAVTQVKPEPVTLVPWQRDSLKTQLDPAHLKKADKAPENPKFVASHHSVATKPKPRPLSAPSATPASKSTPTPAATPKPAVPESDVASMELALLKKAGIAPEPTAVTRPTPIPHPASTAPVFRTSLPRPTPVPMAPTPKPTGVFAAAAPVAVTPVVKAPPQPVAPPLAGEMPAGETGNDDEVGVDAIGKWTKAVGNAVGSCWNFYRQSKMDLLVVGEVRIKFLIDALGHISEVSIVSNTANPTNAMYAVRSVREAEIPPIPPERLAKLPNGRVAFDLTLTILPTQ